MIFVTAVVDNVVDVKSFEEDFSDLLGPGGEMLPGAPS